MTRLGRVLISRQVAERLNVNIATVERLARCGDLPAFRIGTGPRAQFRFDEDEIERWLESREVKPAPEPIGEVHDDTFR